MISFGVGVGGRGGAPVACFSWRVTMSFACFTQSMQMLPSAPGMIVTSLELRPQNEQMYSSCFMVSGFRFQVASFKVGLS